MAGLIVQVTGRRFAIPFECPCCGAPPDTELHLPRARGAHAAADSATGIDIPYCSRCMRHAEAWDHAGVGSAFVLVLGVLAFIGMSLVAARPLLGLFALLASIPLALIVAGARRRHARAACTEACASPGIALAYQGYNGTLTSIAFESLTYAARFAEHNTGIVLETPQLRRLLEGHRIARLQVPTPAAAVSSPPLRRPPNGAPRSRRERPARPPHRALPRARRTSRRGRTPRCRRRRRRSRARPDARKARALDAARRNASTSRPRSPRYARTTFPSRCKPPSSRSSKRHSPRSARTTAKRGWRHSGDAGARRSDRCQHVPQELARLAEQVRNVLHRARRSRSLLDRNDHLLELDHTVECRVKSRQRHEVRPLAHGAWMQQVPRQLPGAQRS